MTASVPLRERVFAEHDPVRVSICSITFNHAAYMRDCLEGFLDQVCDFRVEIVIHDDASTDGTTGILRDYAQRYPTVIRPIYQTDNQFSKGVNPYYAYVFPSARGEYLAICDGDDHWQDPAKLAAQVAVLDHDSSVALTFGLAESPTDGTIHQFPVRRHFRDLSPFELKCGPSLLTLTTCFRNVFRDGPPIFLRSSPVGDMTVWAVLGYYGSGRYMADLPPAIYNRHSGGIFSDVSAMRRKMMVAIGLLTIAAYHAERGDSAASRACVRRSLGLLVQAEDFWMLSKRMWKNFFQGLRGKA